MSALTGLVSFFIGFVSFISLWASIPDAMGQSINLGVLTDMTGIYSTLSGRDRRKPLEWP